MKAVLTITVLITAIGLGVLLFEQLVKESHMIGQVTRVSPANGRSVIAGDEIRAGVESTLLDQGMSPSDWGFSAASPWQPTNTFHISNMPVQLLIILTNKIDLSEVYVRVRSAASGNELEYYLYRPK